MLRSRLIAVNIMQFIYGYFENTRQYYASDYISATHLSVQHSKVFDCRCVVDMLIRVRGSPTLVSSLMSIIVLSL